MTEHPSSIARDQRLALPPPSQIFDLGRRLLRQLDLRADQLDVQQPSSARSAHLDSLSEPLFAILSRAVCSASAAHLASLAQPPALCTVLRLLAVDLDKHVRAPTSHHHLCAPRAVPFTALRTPRPGATSRRTWPQHGTPSRSHATCPSPLPGTEHRPPILPPAKVQPLRRESMHLRVHHRAMAVGRPHRGTVRSPSISSDLPRSLLISLDLPVISHDIPAFLGEASPRSTVRSLAHWTADGD